jgi:plastocyanin/mono/diheme cytochrome c family protein
MERRELLAVLAAVFIIVGLPTAALAYHWRVFVHPSNVRTVDVVAAAPENGGFYPDLIRAAAGETVRLRFSVPDVTHGIAIGPGVGVDLGQIEPGHVAETEVTFDRPGRYTVYCNTWCSPSHWRMRATVEVYDSDNPTQLVSEEHLDPVIAQLAAAGIDIDAAHEAAYVPVTKPAANRGETLLDSFSVAPELKNDTWRRAHSPAEAFALLRQSEPPISSRDAWDVVAFLWLKELTKERRDWAATQYARNCVACHGETGNGRGPGADVLRAQGLGKHARDHGEGPVVAAYDDPRTMLGGASNIYYAKVRRGGMGTGMPSFGPIFTEEETWRLVDYLWSFQFENGE